MNINNPLDTSGESVLSQYPGSDSPESTVTNAISPRKEFRWRIIFVTLLVFYGLCAFAVSIFHFALAAKLLIEGSAPTAMINVLAGDALGIVVAITLIITAVNLQKGRWSYAALIFLVGIILGYLGHALGGGR